MIGYCLKLESKGFNFMYLSIIWIYLLYVFFSVSDYGFYFKLYWKGECLVLEELEERGEICWLLYLGFLWFS